MKARDSCGEGDAAKGMASVMAKNGALCHYVPMKLVIFVALQSAVDIKFELWPFCDQIPDMSHGHGSTLAFSGDA